LNILILKPSSLGDVAQALPVLRLLKLHLPRSRIYWWIDAGLSSLLDHDPDLEGVITFERRRWASPPNLIGFCESLRLMRSLRFDLVIDLQSLARSGAVAWLANGEFTIGLDDAREGARGFYDVAIPRPATRLHAIDWYLEVLRYLRVPIHDRFTWLPARPDVQRRIEDRWDTRGRRWMVIAPGARWANKRWPASSFGALVRSLGRADPALHFAVVGTPADEIAGDEIAKSLPERCLNLAGKTPLPELVEWLRLSEGVIANDTGPVHLAAALRKPVWALFGPTHPARTGPYGQIHRALRLTLPCAPCMSGVCRNPRQMECLRALTAESVAHSILGAAIQSASETPLFPLNKG